MKPPGTAVTDRLVATIGELEDVDDVGALARWSREALAGVAGA